MRLLLLSNSYSQMGFLNHCEAEIKILLQGVKSILFIPFALDNYDDYFQLVSESKVFEGVNVKSIHTTDNLIEEILTAESIFIGGGNTFRLLNTLYKYKLLNPLRSKIKAKIPYIGASAGTNIICPTIKTTNDMPIVYPPKINSLNIIRFQINPHYPSNSSDCKMVMESRDERIAEYHQENLLDVLGMKEGSFLKIENQTICLLGTAGAKLFRKNSNPINIDSGSSLSYLFKD